MKKCNRSKGLTTKAYRKVVAQGIAVIAFRMYCGMGEEKLENVIAGS